MGGLQNLLEPGGKLYPGIAAAIRIVTNVYSTSTAIVAVFTTGTLINRRRHVRSPEIPSVESPLLADGLEDVKPNTDDERSLRNRRTPQSRLLAHFPFLLEILYWLLTYWV